MDNEIFKMKLTAKFQFLMDELMHKGHRNLERFLNRYTKVYFHLEKLVKFKRAYDIK